MTQDEAMGLLAEAGISVSEFQTQTRTLFATGNLESSVNGRLTLIYGGEYS